MRTPLRHHFGRRPGFEYAHADQLNVWNKTSGNAVQKRVTKGDYQALRTGEALEVHSRDGLLVYRKLSELPTQARGPT